MTALDFEKEVEKINNTQDCLSEKLQDLAEKITTLKKVITRKKKSNSEFHCITEMS